MFLSVFPEVFSYKVFLWFFPGVVVGPTTLNLVVVCYLCLAHQLVFFFCSVLELYVLVYMYPKMFSGCTTSPKHSQCYVRGLVHAMGSFGSSLFRFLQQNCHTAPPTHLQLTSHFSTCTDKWRPTASTLPSQLSL